MWCVEAVYPERRITVHAIFRLGGTVQRELCTWQQVFSRLRQLHLTEMGHAPRTREKLNSTGGYTLHRLRGEELLHPSRPAETVVLISAAGLQGEQPRVDGRM